MSKRTGWWLFWGAGISVLGYAWVHGPSAPGPRTVVPDEPTTASAKALDALDRLIAFHATRATQDPTAWLDLDHVARAYLRRAHLTGSYDDYARADQALREAFGRAPDGAGPFFTRAQLSYALHRLDRVAADLERARPAVRDGSLRRAIEETKAALAFQRGDYLAAETGYRRLLERRRTPGVLARMAQYRWKTGDVAAAEALFVEAHTRTPSSDLERRAWLQLMRGLLDLDRGRPHEALAHYEEADTLFGGWYLIEEHIAEALALTGRPREAQRLYRKLVRTTQNPEFMDALASVAEELGDREEAEDMMVRATAAYEARLLRFPEASFGHALDHYLDRGDAERAVELAEKNHAIRPSAEAATKLAQAYRLAGRAEDARRAVKLALATPWSTPELRETAEALRVQRPKPTR